MAKSFKESCADCWQGLSRFYLILLTSISIVAGIVLLALSVYLKVEFKQFNDPIVQGVAVWGPFAVALVIIVSSVAGLVGSCYLPQNPIFAKCMLSTYLIFTLILWLAVLVVSIMMLVYISTCREVGSRDSFKLSGSGDKMNTWQLAVFNKCCADKGWADFEVEPCGEDPAKGACQEQSRACACYNSKDDYDRIAQHIDDDECEVLQDIKFHGIPLIGNMTSGGCGSGDPKQFQEDFSTYVDDYVFPVNFGILALALLMLVAGCCTCCMLGSRQRSYKQAGINERDDGTMRLDPDQSETMTMS